MTAQRNSFCSALQRKPEANPKKEIKVEFTLTKTCNLIDYILINNRWKSNATNCRSFDVQIGSYCKEIIVTMKIKLMKVIQPAANIKYGTKKLKYHIVSKNL